MNDEPRLTSTEWHRQQAIDLFNFTWTLIEKPDRTPDEDNMMIHAAHASRFHWGMVGDVENFVRGNWQIAHVYTLLGHTHSALYHAQCCLEQCLADQIGDFDLAYAYEAVARAQACAGNHAEAQQFYRLAAEAGDKIAEDDDRVQFKRDLAAGPWFDEVDLSK
jgi:hypothetical protein